MNDNYPQLREWLHRMQEQGEISQSEHIACTARLNNLPDSETASAIGCSITDLPLYRARVLTRIALAAQMSFHAAESAPPVSVQAVAGERSDMYNLTSTLTKYPVHADPETDAEPAAPVDSPPNLSDVLRQGRDSAKNSGGNIGGSVSQPFPKSPQPVKRAGGRPERRSSRRSFKMSPDERKWKRFIARETGTLFIGADHENDFDPKHRADLTAGYTLDPDESLRYIVWLAKIRDIDPVDPQQKRLYAVQQLARAWFGTRR